MTAREAPEGLRLSGVGRRFGAVAALEGLDLAVAPRSRTAVVGPSGSGKTTLLRIVAGFERPDSGRVVLDGAVLAGDGAFVPAHRRGIGYVSQDGALFPHLSIADNIAFGLPRRAPDRAARARALLDLVELDAGHLVRRPHELSGGQQQRVALARALAREPRLMLLDEPFSALDPALRGSLREAVLRLLDQAGIATILVTHDREEALACADQVAVLSGGRLVRAGPPREVYRRPVRREAALIVGEALILLAELRGGVADCALGAFPVDAAGTGPAEIMLRHEQVRLLPASEGAGVATVHAVAFRGTTCVVTLGPDGAPPLALILPSTETPDAGTRVAVEVRGAAHVLDGVPPR